ncbi:sensor histidine kinase [Polaromonas sp.]|uniref:sensor histidine kinase n=1 Tax=Polaromonas sp. TaxID=1869339 RepID=UPI003CA425F3
MRCSLRCWALSCLLWCGMAQAGLLELHEASAVVTVQDVTTADRVALPYHWDRHHRGQAGDITFEIPFPVAAVKEEPYGVYFQRIGNTAEVWLNGALVARFGDPRQPNTGDYAKGPQYVSIPARLLRQDNLLRIHVHADGGRRGGLSALVIGTESEVRPLYVSSFNWRVSASMGVMIFSLLVGGIAMALWVSQPDPVQGNRRDRVYLFAGLAEIFWALRVGDVAIEQPLLAWPVWGVVVTAAFAGWFCCIALFCHHVAGWHKHASMPWVRGGLSLLFASAIVVSTLSFALREPVYLTAWLGMVNVLFIVYAAVYLWGAIRHPGTEWLMVAIAGTLNVLMGVRDWVAIRVSGSYIDNTWIRYSSVLFGLVLGYIVIRRFRAVSVQATDLMTNLSSRIAQKEQELGQTYQKVEQLAREQERVSERTRILRDMHDGVGAHLSAAIRQLQSGKASSEDVLQTLRYTLDQLKLSIDAMHLLPGDISSLLANLRYRLEPRFAASDIELQWVVGSLEPVARMDANAMRQLQFMVFEALSNVLQHSHATTLAIEAEMAGSGVCLRVVDNGRGFDAAAPPRKGLLAMRERATAIGVSIAIESRPGRTAVEIRIT